MNCQKICFALALLMAPAAVQPASNTIEGPRLGFVYDHAVKSVRPILGIPGAATLGQPVESGLDLRKIAMSPMQDYVLATEGEHNQVVVLATNRTPLVAVAVQGADRGPDQLSISAGGTAAALYYKGGNHILVISGLPAAPRISERLYLSAGQAPSALAVSDDGQTLLAGIADSVYWVSPSGEVPILRGLHKIVSIALGSNHTALVADGVANQIHRVQNVTTAVEPDVVAGPKQGIAAPIAVAMSQDGKRAFVANSKSGTVAILDLQAKTELAQLSCQCTPTGLDRLSGADVFRLTEPLNGPMWVLDGAAHQSRIVFVPPASKQE
jgi:DNA-binding beta-propeller fold protein YncE